ncbi:T-complex protein 11-like protein 1 [Aplysia californica]|uniref:T-complex protein 11-like protein 1 n=1 Tax=Aplysia californica TaxID=6500 RepID=A0ABM0JYR1_APLCA|nr:T-complex protein 11-like protein 1 [Aplysia californica]XP_005104685.1 T-complex protein 11-like protein 1 [Aplysia californica]XP_005104688.1 T-complex protein 11-like protein 1 [Aplysia californica]
MSTPDKNKKLSDEQEGEDNGQQASPRRAGIPDELLNMVGASPPKFVNFDQLMQAADGMKNMSLAHEIAVNNDFELEQQIAPPNSLEKQVRDTVQRAFWDAFEDKLSRDPPDLSMAYGMLEELKESLIAILLPQHQRLKDQINEVLDLSLIKQQMENEAFDFDFYGRYVTDTMAKLCAPARDEKIAEIKGMKEVTPKFRAILEMLELMRKDMANFTIRQIRPYIQQNSIEYERKKFSDYFDAQKALGINALQYTEVWLQRNYQKMLQNASDPQMSSGSQDNPMPTPANVLTQAYVEILNWSDPMNFPETLMMDQFRFMGMRDKLQMLGLISSVQLITYSVVGPSVEGVEQLKKQLKEHVEILLTDRGEKGIGDILDSVSEQVVKDVGESLASRQLPPLSEDKKEGLKGQIANLGSRENKVRQIMMNRLLEFIQEGISGKSLNNLRVPKGCTAVQQELAQVLGNFLRLTSHNRSVFGAQYTQIIELSVNRSSDVAEASGGQSC